MKIAILRDSIPTQAAPDQLDCLVEAAAVSQALSELGHDTYEIEFSRDAATFVRTLEASCPDLVFNLVESVDGEGRLVYTAPALLDWMGLPYTGSSTEAILLTSHKLVAKSILAAHGIPTPLWVSMDDLCDKKKDVAPGMYIIKSVWEHASLGLEEDSVVSVIDGKHLFEEMNQRLHKLRGHCFAEIYIDGREFNIAILEGDDGPRVLPPAEMVFHNYPEGKHKVVGYRAKWIEQSYEYHHTIRNFQFPSEDHSLLATIENIALACWRIFALRGYARVDVRVDKEGRPWVLEVNANPCIAPDAGFVAAAQIGGLTYTQLIDRILSASRMS